MVIIAGTGQGLIGLMRTGRQDKYTTYPSPVCRGLSLGAASSCFLVLTVSNQWTQPRQLEAHLLCCCSQFSPDDILESVSNVVLITVKSI